MVNCPWGEASKSEERTQLVLKAVEKCIMGRLDLEVTVNHLQITNNITNIKIMVKGGVYINVLHNGELSSYNTNILWIVLILTEEIISCNPGLDVES